MREHDLEFSPVKNRRRRFDDDEPTHRRRRGSAPVDLDGRAGADIDGPPTGDRWSTWDGALHGPRPRPRWVITDHAAVDTELGVLKTGKEADVHLLERAVPDTGRRVLLAAKRYRSAEHRMFHRDAGYLEGRRVRRSREMRAMATAHGVRPRPARRAVGCRGVRGAGAALGRRCRRALPGAAGRHGAAAGVRRFTRRARPPRAWPSSVRTRTQLADLWSQLAAALRGLARHGLTHGDLSAFNLLVARRPAGPDRPAAGRRRGRQPAGAGSSSPGTCAGSPTGSRRAGCRPRRTQRPRCSRTCAPTCTFPGQAVPAQPHTSEKVTPIGGEAGGPIGRASRMLDHERPAVPA